MNLYDNRRESEWIHAIVDVGLDEDEIRTARIAYVYGPYTPIEQRDLNEPDWIRSEIENGDGGDLVNGVYPIFDTDELPEDGFYLVKVKAWGEEYNLPTTGWDYSSGLDVNDPKEWIYLSDTEGVVADPDPVLWWVMKSTLAGETA